MKKTLILCFYQLALLCMIQHYTPNTSGQYNSKEYIMLHHTATGYGSINGVINRFTLGRASAHYIIDTNGDIHQMNTDNDVLWHAGTGTRDGHNNMNAHSIGIEIVGPLPGFTNPQRRSVRKLILQLMQAYQIPAHRIIRHKDYAPNRKVDVYDSFRNQQYGNFQAYQQSYKDIQIIKGYYETLFTKEFTDQITEGDTIIANIDGAQQEIMNVDGTFNLKEFIYLSQIGLERVHKEFLHTNTSSPMGKYEKIFKKEFAEEIADGTTIISNIDKAVDNCINDDGTLNLRELLYFMNIGLERVRKEI